MKFDLPQNVVDYDLKALREVVVPCFIENIVKNASVTLKIIARDGKITGTKIEIDNPWPPDE